MSGSCCGLSAAQRQQLDEALTVFMRLLEKSNNHPL
jgi:hypothetical protein